MKLNIYEFIYLDKNGNELKKDLRKCSSKKNAINLSKALFDNTRINDLHKIKTRKFTCLKLKYHGKSIHNHNPGRL